jgi:hypothetical protein
VNTLFEKLLGPEEKTISPAVSNRAMRRLMIMILSLCAAVVGFVGYHDITTTAHTIHHILNNNPPAPSFWDKRIR